MVSVVYRLPHQATSDRDFAGQPVDSLKLMGRGRKATEAPRTGYMGEGRVPLVPPSRLPRPVLSHQAALSAISFRSMRRMSMGSEHSNRETMRAAGGRTLRA